MATVQLPCSLLSARFSDLQIQACPKVNYSRWVQGRTGSPAIILHVDFAATDETRIKPADALPKYAEALFSVAYRWRHDCHCLQQAWVATLQLTQKPSWRMLPWCDHRICGKATELLWPERSRVGHRSDGSALYHFAFTTPSSTFPPTCGNSKVARGGRQSSARWRLGRQKATEGVPV